MINWTATQQELETIILIADRATKMDYEYPVTDAIMDIEACHCNGMPLQLDKLLAADDFNFAHDVFGIRAHINRSTGSLEGCFVPRYAKPDLQSATR